MALFSSRSSGRVGSSQAEPSDAAETIDAMRRRARHRLIGATVLVALGVIGFPLLFDTQPRPVPVDIPIEIPDRNKSAPVVLAPAAAVPSAAGVNATAAGNTASVVTAQSSLGPREQLVAAASGPAEKKSAPPPVEPESQPEPDQRPEATKKPVAAKADRAAESKPDGRAQKKPDEKPPAKAQDKDTDKAQAATAASPKSDLPAATRDDLRIARAEEAARARALLQGKSVKEAAAIAEGRFIVQVGAFSEPGLAQATRAKVERAGLRTYTQEAKTANGTWIRVRVGPFATRAEADQAASKIKGLSLPASILTL